MMLILEFGYDQILNNDENSALKGYPVSLIEPGFILWRGGPDTLGLC